MPKGSQGFQPGNNVGCQFQSKSKIDLICHNCNKDFKVQPWDAKRGRKYCSSSCRSSFTMKKERHWNWQGGISNRWDTLHNSKEYKEWRMAVFQRDRFVCQECGCNRSRKNPLHAHHVKLKSEYPGLVLDVDNGKTLCKQCHVNLHKGRHR